MMASRQELRMGGCAMDKVKRGLDGATVSYVKLTAVGKRMQVGKWWESSMYYQEYVYYI